MKSPRKVHVNGEVWLWSTRSMNEGQGFVNIYSPTRKFHKVPLKEFELSPERCGVTESHCAGCFHCNEYGSVSVTPRYVKKYIEEKILKQKVT